VADIDATPPENRRDVLAALHSVIDPCELAVRRLAA
jgi:hypothetical protein